MIKALQPKSDSGHQFVVYGDSCSGIPGGRHEVTLAAVNAVIRRLNPAPEFICFLGDEIQGLIADENELREQWAYWLEHEMRWLDRAQIPLYHTTSNHTTYDQMSEKVFTDMLDHLPANGPVTQKGLSYYVRRGNLLLVFINTLWSGRGGEGRVETEWLEQVLLEQRDATYKFVFGHHPVFPVNGFSGDFQREINRDDGSVLWDVLVKHQVMVYWCSHILAFDVQVHRGVLQIVTAGAGTAHRMPEETEYLHFVQAAVDETGLCYQVVDTQARVRESLQWPMPTPHWIRYQSSDEILFRDILMWKFIGHSAPTPVGYAQTLICSQSDSIHRPAIWIGLTGSEQRLTIYLAPTPGRSAHHWYGPTLPQDRAFELHIALHRGMGPGGLMWRWGDTLFWSSLKAASHWGLERLAWTVAWHTGEAVNHNERFMGQSLEVFIDNVSFI